MGNACSQCTSCEAQYSPEIRISKTLFAPVDPKPQLIDEIKSLLSSQSLNQLGGLNQFQKGQDTYFFSQNLQTTQPSFGVLYKPGQTIYCGKFMNGMFDGHGILKLINKNISFQGQFKEGKPFQQGKVQDQNHTFQFAGTWDGHYQPKLGILKLTNDKNIENINFLDFQQGNVQISYKNGMSYKGFVQKDSLLPQGIGKMKYPSGDTYDGEWVHGKFEGTGTYTWKNGKIYNGEYKQGLRDGQGTLHYSESRYFTGFWKKGKREGYGKIVDKNGVILQNGIYYNDRFDHEINESYLDNFMTKVPRDEIKSQLMDCQVRDDLQIQNKEGNN